MPKPKEGVGAIYLQKAKSPPAEGEIQDKKRPSLKALTWAGKEDQRKEKANSN